MEKPKTKKTELSDAELKDVTGGAAKKRVVRKVSGVELTAAELQSASGGTRTLKEPVIRMKK